jgi:addiction module HigA family antidote
MAKSRRLSPVHPGEILREDLMAPLGLSINGLARDLRVPVTRMSEIVNGRRSITADTALRLARFSRRRLNSGSICRAPTISMSPDVRLLNRSSETCIRERRRSQYFSVDEEHNARPSLIV